MDLSGIKLFGMMKQRIAYHSERQSVLAKNVANANTPGYKPYDLKKVNFAQMANEHAKSIPLAATHPGHMSTGVVGSTRFAAEEQDNTFETTPTGNSVVLEEQMLKMSQNRMDYEMTTSLYRKMLDLMRIATGSGGG